MSELVQIRSKLPAASPLKRQGLYIKTFGCQMNEYDSQKLAKILEGEYELVDSPEKAGLILINTCSVRDKPEQKLYSLLGQVKEFKEGNNEVLIGVGGCVAQQEGATIVKRSKAVDFVFGTHNLSLVPSLVKLRKEGAPPQVAVDYREEWEDWPIGFTEGSRISAFVSISRGCNKNCSYCIVPTTRGKEVSRDPKEIEREVRIAVHRGAKEIVLLGQTVNSYGRDFSPKMTFVQLLEQVAAIDGVHRIRFTSPHPQEIREDFIEFVCRNPKICHHVHMPLQSGSDKILKLMNRNYRKNRYLQIIEALKKGVPDITITTDIIVGFPGETEEDFLETMEVMNIVKFQNSYSFAFSKRPGTVAEGMEETVSHEEKLRRLQILQARQEELGKEYLESCIGKEFEILIEGPSAADGSLMQGRTSQNVTVNMVRHDPSLVPGMIVKATVTGAARFTLRADH